MPVRVERSRAVSVLDYVALHSVERYCRRMSTGSKGMTWISRLRLAAVRLTGDLRCVKRDGCQRRTASGSVLAGVKTFGAQRVRDKQFSATINVLIIQT